MRGITDEGRCESTERLIRGRSGGKSGLEEQGHKCLLLFNIAEKKTGRKGVGEIS